ncbi:hypothetical protein [Streptomyces sp. RerS4]|uniref:hypothetical protein n=1 Tax=Streptomyces sp. RerS4 TaxID=2942449 RepID=UPI00201C6F28|nr:hypothetical protein [Streptomyces sp. RerS4]UQX00191.1 hypothetical protein M4D82_06295 [Streptomyces sp. RerS4]
MTTLETSTPRTGRRRRPEPYGFEESVRQRTPDPPIYGALLAHWAADGRTLPGRRDPEWTRVVSTPIWPNGPLFNA